MALAFAEVAASLCKLRSEPGKRHTQLANLFFVA
jgi:hypothetical protein